MKRNQVTKQNTFKRHAVNPEGKLIVLDATKDVTEQDTVRLRYYKLQSEQFSPLPEFNPKAAISAYLMSFALLILFFTFAYLILT